MNLELLRTFLVVLEEGSLNKAAARCRLSQSTLTRQIQALEQELGGQLLERTSNGVVATAAGKALVDGVEPLLERFDTVLQNIRNFARGQRDVLRIGYVSSAVTRYLNKALAGLRQEYPDIKVQLLDLSPGEQMALLREGEIDVALFGSAGSFFTREFYLRRLASLNVVVAMPECDPLATKESLQVADFQGRLFVGAPEEDLPGYNQWLSQLCRNAGYKARFVQNAESLTHALSIVVTDNALHLLPGYFQQNQVPGVLFKPLEESEAKWEMYVAWPRGRMANGVKCLLSCLFP